MPGPARKPAAQRQRRNDDGAGELAAVPELAEAVAPPPSLRLKATKAAWSEFWESSVARLIDVRSDIGALTRLFELYDEIGTMGNFVRKNGRVSLGSTGQVTLNPIYKHMTTIRGEITALEDRFGLTPSARLKLGATLGNAAASLDKMNQQLADQDPEDDDDADDPRRLGAIPTTAS